jgi:hypothetical protein
MFKAEFLIKNSLSRKLMAGLHHDPDMPANYGGKSWDMDKDAAYNAAHLLKDGKGNVIPKKYEEGFSPRDTVRDKIYWKDTYDEYVKWSKPFIAWLDAQKDIPRRFHSMKDVWQYVPRYLKERMDYLLANEKSAWTYDLEKSALVKALDIPYELTKQGNTFMPKMPRHYGDIKRTRAASHANARLNHTKWDPMLDIVGTMGLRHREVIMLQGGCCYQNANGIWFAHLTHGTKGGRIRETRLFGTPEQIKAAVDKVNGTPADKRVWEGIPKNTVFHGIRADYANKCYWTFAPQNLEDIKKIPKEQRVKRTRITRTGKKSKTEWFYKPALAEVTANLGHSKSRHNVAAQDYVRGGYTMAQW